MFVLTKTLTNYKEFGQNIAKFILNITSDYETISVLVFLKLQQ